MWGKEPFFSPVLLEASEKLKGMSKAHMIDNEFVVDDVARQGQVFHQVSQNKDFVVFH